MENSNRGKAIASLVLGIVSLLFWFVPVPFSFAVVVLCGIIGLVLGVQARRTLVGQPGHGMATAGMICSIIALAFGVLVFVACTICVGGMMSMGMLS